MTEIRIYFEGDKALRQGFSQFLVPIRDAARARRIGFRPVAVDGKSEENFQIGIRSHPDACNVLLREGPDAPQRESVFWMVQLMEAWFLADQDALQRFYGDGFRRNALKQNPQVEQILKADVLESLNRATRETQKGRYHKTQHAPLILESLDPAKVRAAAPNCDRLFRALLAKLDN